MAEESTADEIRELAGSLGMMVRCDSSSKIFTAWSKKGNDAFIKFSAGGAEMLATLKRMKGEADDIEKAATERSKLASIYEFANALGVVAYADPDANLYEVWRTISAGEKCDLLLSTTSAAEMIEKLEAMATEAGSHDFTR